MPDETAISIQAAHDALQELEETLSQAYEDAKSPAVRDLLDSRLDAVEKLLTAMNRADISSRNLAFKAATDSTAKALVRLKELQARIKTIADDFGKAAQALEAVDKVLSGVKEYFGI